MQLPSLLSHFPPVSYGFAYGSGVFHQAGLYDDAPVRSGGPPAGPMVDMIFVVDDPVQWHAQNILRNRRHYSFMGSLGARSVAWAAERIGAGTYFNTLVPLGPQYIKYGVIASTTLTHDLATWHHLYVCGRLHKPVLHLVPPPPAMQPALQANVRHALRTALLLSPEVSTLQELFRRVGALSYTGDVRMGVAEDGSKVDRIVAGSYAHFVELYTPALQDPALQAAGVQLDAQQAIVRQDMHAESRVQLLSQLPLALLAVVARKAGASLPEGVGLDSQVGRLQAAAVTVRDGRHARLVSQGLRSLVFASSARQALLGLLSAGVGKSIIYVGRKLAKACRR